ncbi:MAG: YlqD family protein [Candidatus Eremiobacterota bacterium]
MQKIILRRPVSVVAVMTENFRDQMIKEAENTLKRIEEDLRQIETESVKYIASVSLQNPQQASSLTQQMNEEKQRLKTTQVQLDKKIMELENIKNGTEVPFQTFDSFIEVGVGDNLYNRLNKTVVVIKDWVVIDIRES